MKLLYVTDVFCPWCYGFIPVMRRLVREHPSLPIRVLGGNLMDQPQRLSEMLKTFAINSKSVPKNSSVMASTLQSTPIRSTNFSLFSTKSKISSVSKWSSRKSLLRSKSRA